MADIYVRSTDGSDADNGSTWALAKASVDAVDGATSIDNAGDTIWLSQNHSESTASSVVINTAGTLATPSRLLCGNDAAEPPTALATGAAVAVTGSSDLSVGGSLYAYGITFTSSRALETGGGSSPGTHQIYEECDFRLTNAGSSGVHYLGTSAGNYPVKVTFINCRWHFNAASNVVEVQGDVTIRGGSIISGSATKSQFIRFSASSGRHNKLLIEGFDFSNFANTFDIFVGSTTSLPVVDAIVRNCKMPSGWDAATGLLSATPGGLSQRYSLLNCSDGDHNYKLRIETAAGSITEETTIVRDGGASDGTTPISWKMATSADGAYNVVVLRSPEIRYWNETTGSAITLTVEIVHDSQGSGTSSAFTDKEIWLEAQYLGTADVPLGSFIDDAAADVLASAADQTSSSVTWTTTGLSTPVKQKLSVTLTPEEKGIILLTVCMAGASDTCYVCPKVTVS